MSDRRLLLLILVMVAMGIALFIPLSDSAEGKTIIVDDDGEDGGDGSAGAPFRYIQDALNVSAEGDIIDVAPGNYYETMWVNTSVDIVGGGIDSSFLYGKGKGLGGIVEISADNVSFTGFTLRNANTALSVQGKNCTIREVDCGMSSYGILLISADNTTILNSWSQENDNYGLGMLWSGNCTFTNMVIMTNVIYGVYIYESDGGVFHNNIIARNGGEGIRVRNSHWNTFTNNTFDRNIWAGCFLVSSENNTITGNILTRGYKGINVVSGSVNTTIAYNHFYDNGLYGLDATANSGEKVIATNNWWGSPTGPYHLVENSIGQGDNVSDLVEFDPWLLQGIGGEQWKYVWYVNASAPDGGNGSFGSPFNRIQRAVDVSGPGDIVLVGEGRYRENVEVDHPVEIVGSGMERTYIEGVQGESVLIVKAENVSISGFNLVNRSTGIRVQADNTTIAWNNCSNAFRGILVENVVNVTLVDNICSDSEFAGIMLDETIGSLLERNLCERNGIYGILLSFSAGAMVRENHCNENDEYGISLEGSSLNTLIDNHCEGNPEDGIRIWNSYYNEINGSLLRENGFGIYLHYSDWNRLISNDCSNNSRTGIQLEGSDENELISNNCSNNIVGIELNTGCRSNRLEMNICIGNLHTAMGIIEQSEFNDILNNTCIGGILSIIYIHDSNYNDLIGNHVSGGVNNPGINAQDSENLILRGNECVDGDDGIVIDFCDSVRLEENICSRNGDQGIVITNSETVTLKNNTCSRNGEAGVFLDSTNVSLYGNIIDFNTKGIVARSTSKTTVQFNEIYGNREYGIEVKDDAQFELLADWNWWGSPSGPYHPETNPDGHGDRVSDKVIYREWLGMGTQVILQTTRYVDADAIDGEGNGTFGNPYATINEALRNVRREDTIRVLEGVYYERIIIDEKVRIIGDHYLFTTINAMGFGVGVTILADEVELRGFTIRNTAPIENYAGILIRSDGNIIRDVLCTENYHGIYLSESSDNDLNHVTCNANGGDGITFGSEGSNRNTVRESWFFNNRGSGIDMSGGANNNISLCSILTNDLMGISARNSFGSTIRNNSISFNFHGIGLNDSNDVKITGNEIFSNNVSGLLLHNPLDSSLINNSIAYNGEGIIITGISQNNIIKDNKFKENDKFGLNATGNVYLVDARSNDWGNMSGPFHRKKNRGGDGDRVSDNVMFEPWVGWVDSGEKDDNEWDEQGPVVAGLLVMVLVLLVSLLSVIGLSVFSERVPENVRKHLPIDERDKY